MTTEDGYAAAGSLIRGQADQWDAQAPKLATIGQQVGAMRFQGYDAGGLFKGIRAAHADVIVKVHDRCGEGHVVFQKISETLRILAARYEKMDQDVAAQLRSSGGQPATDKLLRNGTPRIMVDQPPRRAR